MSRTHYKLLLENAFLGQWDLALPDGGYKKATVIIAKAEKFTPEVKQRKKVKRADGSYEYVDTPNKKLCLTFRNARKPWLCGPTNQKTIAELYGPYLEDWTGKAITLYVDESVQFGGKKTGGIRVENKVPRAGVSPMVESQPVDVEKAKAMADAVDGSGTREPGQEG